MSCEHCENKYEITDTTACAPNPILEMEQIDTTACAPITTIFCLCECHGTSQ